MSRLNDHLMIAPVVLPLVAAAFMLALGGERRNVNAAISLASTLALVAIAFALLRGADAAPAGVLGVYRLGNWPAPFAIVLVVDRLSALMLVLTNSSPPAPSSSRLPAGTAPAPTFIRCSSSSSWGSMAPS